MNSKSKYHQVENHLLLSIEKGVFMPEDKLPSIRILSQQLNVSKNTVIRAYQELEAIGIIYSVAKSGYRVKPNLTQQQSIPVEPSKVDLLSLSKSVLSYPEGKPILPTGSAHPNTNSNAIKSLYAEVGRHSRMQSQIPSHYQLPPGNDLLIQQLLRISQSMGINAAKSDLAITHGAQQGISLALRALTQPGDIVAIESPCYFGSLLLLESLGLQVLEIPSNDHYGIDVEELKKSIQKWPVKAIIVTPNFTNPSGARMPLEHRKKLLSYSEDIPIIEDDVFGGLSADSGLPALKALDKTGRVIYVSSLSKTLDSRLRIGWIISERYQKQIEKHLICESMGSLNLMQSAVGEFLTTGKYRSHLTKMRRVYQHNQKRFAHYLVQSLNQFSNLENRFNLTRPQGSYLVWLTLPFEVDSSLLYRECQEQKIIILPGTVFGTKEQYKNCVRMSVANFEDTKDWRIGIEKFASLVSKHVAERNR